MDLVFMLLVATFIACLTVYAFRLITKKRNNLPPEPFGFPLIGHLPFLKMRPYIAHTRFKKLGPICYLRSGLRHYILLNSYEAINKAFVEQGNNFSGKPKYLYFTYLEIDSGILFDDGPPWKVHRRFALRMMREFGLGRPIGESIVQDECQALREALSDLVDTPVSTKAIYAVSINNVISRLVFGERCGSAGRDFEQFTKHFNYVTAPTFVDFMPLFFPFIIRIPFLRRVHEYFSKYHYSFECIHKYIMQKIDQHKEALRNMDPPLSDTMQAHDICEALIIEQMKQQETNPDDHFFTDKRLENVILDLFMAGTETTTTTLTWATLLLAIHPDIQKRVQQEINAKIGHDRLPAMSDRLQLPYVCAVIDDVLRYSSLVPNNLKHRCVQDTELMGYTIPADIMIISNLYGVHHDPELWARPNEFYPDHFLTSEGNYRPSKYLIPFSVGKHACLGESLAKMELFLALVTLMQTFEVRLSESNVKAEDLLLGAGNPVISPGKHKIIFSKLF